jgi:hypothetical protein
MALFSGADFFDSLNYLLHLTAARLRIGTNLNGYDGAAAGKRQW